MASIFESKEPQSDVPVTVTLDENSSSNESTPNNENNANKANDANTNNTNASKSSLKPIAYFARTAMRSLSTSALPRFTNDDNNSNNSNNGNNSNSIIETKENETDSVQNNTTNNNNNGNNSANNRDILLFESEIDRYINRFEVLKNNDELIKIICLYHSQSGGGKSWLFCQELLKYDVITFDMMELATNKNNNKHEMQLKLGTLLHKYQNNCVVAMCGGDGAYSWCINFIIDECIECATKELNKQSENSINIPFPTMCCIPAGTGNDLSRCLGWGFNQVTGRNRRHCIQYISDIHFTSQIRKRFSTLDRWNVKIQFVDELEKFKMELKKENNNNDSNNNNNNIIESDEELYEKIFKKKQYQYDSPLPSSFISYLSFGYDAMVAYTYEQERRKYRNRFSSQTKNGLMYVKHGIGEFFIQSEPLNKKLRLTVDGKEIKLISNCRSCKLVNINAAIGGIFFWGTSKSNKNELQEWTRPKLGDGKLEVMATRGVHSMIAHRANVSHAHRIAQSSDIKLEILETPLALQIDGEAWLVKEKMTLNVSLKDKIPVIIGCHGPLGVETEYEENLYQQSRKVFENKMKQIYHYKDHSGSNSNSNIDTNNNNNSNNNNNETERKSNNIFASMSSMSLRSLVPRIAKSDNSMQK